MTYHEATEYLFNAAPLFQQIGGAAYKEGLHNSIALDTHFGHPHRNFHSIHVAGTNGKGSCSHTIAAILQECGYKVGLYTSPHLLDFRERIRVNGEVISEQYVIDFVVKERAFFEPLQPSFFELTTALAFRYFAESNVDIAVVEVGLGGRLDCTNIITPDLSIITNISFDHMQFLGNTLTQIAGEKAGIIKSNTPVVIGETTLETYSVFQNVAQEKRAPIIFAEENKIVNSSIDFEDGRMYKTTLYGELWGELGGAYQEKNSNTVLHAINVLQRLGYSITEKEIRGGFENVCKLTGLTGRWHRIGTTPQVICDTAHNCAGVEYIVAQLTSLPHDHLHIVVGLVNDKEVSAILAILPKNATYYFTQASVKRALPAEELRNSATKYNLKGEHYTTVKEAFSAAKSRAKMNDIIFVGGSNFVVADFLLEMS